MRSRKKIPKDQDIGLLLTSRALSSLFTRFAAEMPEASDQEVEDAMYAYIQRCERVRNAIGKEWMDWIRQDTPPRSSGL